MKDTIANAAKIFLKDAVNITLDGKVRAGMKRFFKNVAINYEGRQPIGKFLKDSTMR